MNIKQKYITSSLQTHLFSARIMKEHAIFLKAGFTSQNQDFIKKSEYFKNAFEIILSRAVKISNGIINPEIIKSEELVTKFTEKAEEQTQILTGINIDRYITRAQLRLQYYQVPYINPVLFHTVHLLNKESIKLLNELINFKKNILNKVLSCSMFTVNYPLLIKHIIKEAETYLNIITNYENKNIFNLQGTKMTEQFWNEIMMEHALFIRGMLDPTENELIKNANNFADDYKNLLSNQKNMDGAVLTKKSLNKTLEFKSLKEAGTAGIEKCEIRSVILPLLADHVLREANHYIRLLNP